MDWFRSDGTCVRDYLHILDLANGHVLALQNLTADSKVWHDRPDYKYKAYNLGRGTGLSVLNMVEAMRKASGYDYKTEVVGRRYVSLHSFASESIF
jgi:UDP-glucose 4-epimerase